MNLITEAGTHIEALLLHSASQRHRLQRCAAGTEIVGEQVGAAVETAGSLAARVEAAEVMAGLSATIGPEVMAAIAATVGAAVLLNATMSMSTSEKEQESVPSTLVNEFEEPAPEETAAAQVTVEASKSTYDILILEPMLERIRIARMSETYDTYVLKPMLARIEASMKEVPPTPQEVTQEEEEEEETNAVPPPEPKKEFDIFDLSTWGLGF